MADSVIKKYPFLEEEREGKEGAAWLITFADSMSLLLTFFVLLISFSSFDIVRLEQSMESIQRFLGGGLKKGFQTISASYSLSDTETHKTKTFDISLIERPISAELAQSMAAFGIEGDQKMSELKRLLKNNPALLRALLQKQKIPKPEPRRTFKDEMKRPETEMTNAEGQLALQNFAYYIRSEELQDSVRIVESKGDIRIRIDTSALFDHGSDAMKPESTFLLGRITTILKHFPNRVAIENYAGQRYVPGKSSKEVWTLGLSRAEKLINYFVSQEPDIEEERFVMVIRKYDEDEGTMSPTDEGEVGIIGITLLARSVV